jgi:hypothetical protein
MTRILTASVAAALALTVTACTGDSASEAEADPSGATSGAGATDDETGSASPSATASEPPLLWRDATADAIGTTSDWTNKVELADLDSDGDVDLLFANGGDYETPGRPVASQVFLNDGEAGFEEATRRVLGRTRTLARVIRVLDVDGDGNQDVLLGTTFGTQSRLFLGRGDRWVDVTRTHVPRVRLSVGDVKAGDVDGDRDLDLVLAHWGNGNPMQNKGGRTQLWLNDGQGRFTDATDRMPDTLVAFSWDLELLDVDNDWDLDLAVSCKTCPTSVLFENDGRGRFTDVTKGRMPAFTNNYEFTPVDLDADGFLDLVTVNDGEQRGYGLAEHVFRNDGSGGFEDVTDEWWPEDANEGWDDNAVVALDVESDGDADFLIGSLDGWDRLLVNDGAGGLTLQEPVFDGEESAGTLGFAVADLDGDARPDVVDAQGEVEGHEDERVWLGTEVLQPDTAAPLVSGELTGSTVRARVHDNRTPNMPHDWTSVTVRWSDGQRDLTWYGENLFRATVPGSAEDVEVCAVDAAGNETCEPVGG